MGSVPPTARPPQTAPEIGAERGGGGFGGLPDLPESNPEKLIGEVLADRYRILKLLGQGGMGVVYLAEHVVIEKKVALKVLNEELSHSRDVIQRFIGEAKAASRIGHENIIDITDFGTTAQGGVFFVMEHLDGGDLGDRLESVGRFHWTDCRDAGIQICRGLAAAHAKGIIHRDLKPENVFLINHAGRADFVKILDFGIAKFTGLDGGEPKKTKTGMIFGTPDYMSPEQAEGRKADHRVDIYALGIILYQLVTGRLPFIAETFMGVLHQHMAKDPEPPSSLEPSIPPDFEAIILRAMAKDPANRFQSMNEFAEALGACSGSTEAAVSALKSAAVQPATGGAAPDPKVASIPPLKSQSNVVTSKVAALSDELSLPTNQSAVELTSSPLAPPPAPKKSPAVMILVTLAVALGLGVGAFFMLKKGGKSSVAKKTTAEAGMQTAPPVMAAPDASAPRATMSAPPPFVPPAKVLLTIATEPEKAKLYLDGKFIGFSNLENYAIPYGTKERVLQIKRKRYMTVEIKFVPTANQSWERTLSRGKGTTHVQAMKPVMEPPMRRIVIMAVMKPVMTPMVHMDLKDPFATMK